LEWKGQLISLKTDVDQALISVLDGLEKGGPGFKPAGAGQNKRGKKWVVKPKPKLIKKPNTAQVGVLVAGTAWGAGLSSYSNYTSPDLTSEVDQVPSTAGSSPARIEEISGTQIQLDGVSEGTQEVSIVPASVQVIRHARFSHAGVSPVRSEETGGSMPVSPVKSVEAGVFEDQLSKEASFVPASGLASAKVGTSLVRSNDAGGSSETSFHSEGSSVRLVETGGVVSFVSASISEVRRAGFAPTSPDDAGDPLFLMPLGQLGTQSSLKGVFASGEVQCAGFSMVCEDVGYAQSSLGVGLSLDASKVDGLASSVVCWNANDGLEEEGDGSPLRPMEFDIIAPHVLSSTFL
jgi:hypothetical protein